MLGGIANGRSTISGFLAGEDCLATLDAMAAMGVDVQRDSATDLVINGVGLRGLVAPSGDLDLGNSGTAMRLMAGLLSGQEFDSVMVGDFIADQPPDAACYYAADFDGREITELGRLPAIESIQRRPIAGNRLYASGSQRPRSSQQSC